MPPARSPAPRRRITLAQYRTLAAFRYRLRLFLRFSEEACRAAGLTAQQHQALLAITGFPGRSHTTIGELAERLQIAHHSAVGLVHRLGARGLLLRKAGTRDGREVHLRVSPPGRKVLARLTAVHQAELQRLGIPI